MSDKTERHTAMIVGLLRDSYQDTKAENKRLKAENAKLRELVKDMWRLLFDWLFKHHEVPWKEIESVFDRIDELGVEVDE